MTAPKDWPLKTADGRDLAKAKFRVIPGFSKYAITEDGDVKNRETGRILRESHNPKTDAYYYTLYKDRGGKTSRNYAGLVKLAWPPSEAETRPETPGSTEVEQSPTPTKIGPQNGAQQ